MSEATPPRRPSTYHTPRSAPLVLVALRRLWALGLTDGRIAELLSALSPAALRILARRGWTVERAEDLAAAAAPAPPAPPAWTPRQVRHHRRREKLRSRHKGPAAAQAELAYRRRRFQSAAGWGHLLPSADGKTGLLLRRREIEVLNLLRDRGPLTREALYGLMRVERLHARGRSLLARLARAGLVCPRREAGRGLVFRLGKAARCPCEVDSGPRRPARPAPEQRDKSRV